jgi:hypothetical protein
MSAGLKLHVLPVAGSSKMGFESFNVIKTLGEGAFASVLKVPSGPDP